MSSLWQARRVLRRGARVAAGDIAPSARCAPPTPASAPDAAAAPIVAEHLQDSGYALLCNGALLLEGDGLLVVPEDVFDGPTPAA